MSMRPILVDTTRLLTRLAHKSPTGIDRVDLAYARRFLNGGSDRRALAITRFGARLLPHARLDRLLGRITESWAEDAPAETDPALAEVRPRLAGGPARPRTDERARSGAALTDHIRREAFSAGALAWTRPEHAPRDAAYLHTSHLRLDRPELFAWLDRRPDIRPVFFVHDLIPIEFPEYAVPGEDARHRTRMRTVADRAAAVIVNSADVERKLDGYLAAERLRRPPVAVAPLGVEPAFLKPVGVAKAGRPYFVICSTIEARKNHLLLLQVWRELVAEAGREVPALVIVGRRGWESEAAIDLLDRSPALKGHVIETTGLSNAALAELVAGARALLMPSFSEGYGIPIVEALSVGTPVVASDLPVFREIAGQRATFLHPLDGPGWLRTIREAAAAPRSAIPSGYRAPTWDDHFRIVDGVLAGL